MPHETNCSALDGKVKVCNGDYGETGWRGLNNLVITNGFITSSVARMNEFYTGDPSTDDDEMQYVMCHELGHAWYVVFSRVDSFWNLFWYAGLLMMIPGCSRSHSFPT